ncbi:MAG: glycosyltransferase family 4 protein [Pleurocapsa sp.]
MTIKILFISTDLATGGAEMMLYKLLSKIDRTKFQPSVISLMGKDTYGELIEALDIPVHTLEMNQGKPTPNTISKLIKLITKDTPNLIQGWMYHGNLAAQFSSFISKKKIPVLWSIHHSLHSLDSEKLLTQALIRLGGWTAKSVSKIAFVSQKSRLQHQKLGYSAENSCVIPNGFDTLSFQPSFVIKKQLYQELGLASESILIGSIARYHPMKDHATFLQAAQILLTEFIDTHFVLVGTDVDLQNPTLTNLITQLKIGEKVHLLGERRDIPQILPALDIMTSSSAFGEAFPLVIGEAMACQVPCVVTDVGDSALIVEETGRVVPPRNPQALADGWKELILLGAEGRKILGTKARQKVIEHYSLDAIVTQYENLYCQVLNQSI